MKYPTNINLLGRDVEIVYVDYIESEEEGIRVGETDEDRNIIKIKKYGSSSHMRKVVLHEVLHYLIRRSTLYFLLDDKMEEALCTLIEEIGDFVTWDYKSNATFTEIPNSSR